jgi:ADP-ribosylglycohydrolase
LRKDVYFERLEGALYGRMAGCTLGAPVEFWPIAEMAALAEENGDDFPPTDNGAMFRIRSASDTRLVFDMATRVMGSRACRWMTM